MSEALDSQLKFTESGAGSWYIVSGAMNEYYYDLDAAESDAGDDEEACLQTIVESDSAETIKFYWKVSSQQNCDFLEFYIDDTRQDRISGEVDWQQQSYAVSAGIHTLKWRYVKDGSGKAGDDCGWVDFVQWTGPSPAQRTRLRPDGRQSTEGRKQQTDVWLRTSDFRLRTGGRPAHRKEGRWLQHSILLCMLSCSSLVP